MARQSAAAPSPIAVLAASCIAALLGVAPAGAEEPQVWPPADAAAEPDEAWPSAFTHVLEQRKRQLVTSYYLYRGPVPSEQEMDGAIGAIDRLILQDYSLEDIWSTIFNILLSEPQLAHKPFEQVVPPNIRRAAIWREAATPVKVVIEERYPEYSFVYQRALRRKTALTWTGAAVFVPSYAISIAIGTSSTGTMYTAARRQGVAFSAGNAFLPLLPVVGPIASQAVLDVKSRDVDHPAYDPGLQLVGSVWATLLQSLGLTAMVVGLAQRLPEPFGDAAPAPAARRAHLRPAPRLRAVASPTSVGLRLEF